MTVKEKAWIRAFAKSFAADMVRNPNVADGPRELREKIVRDLTRFVKRSPGPVLFPNLRAFLRTQMNVEEARLAGGMGQWAELLTSITDAASSYFSQREKSKTEAKIAEIKLRAAQARAAQEEAAAARDRLAASEGVPGAASEPVRKEDGGVPGWVWIPVAAAGAAVVTKVAGVW